MYGIQYLIIKRDFNGCGYYFDMIRNGVVYEFYTSKDTIKEAFNDFIENYDLKRGV